MSVSIRLLVKCNVVKVCLSFVLPCLSVLYKYSILCCFTGVCFVKKFRGRVEDWFWETDMYGIEKFPLCNVQGLVK